MKTKAIIRLFVAFIVFVNAYLTAAGMNPIPFDETIFTEVATQIANGLMLVWVWWKDAPLTKAGQKGHELTKAIKEDGFEEGVEEDVE